MAIVPFPGSALVEHQQAHLDAILNGELQPAGVPANLPPKTANFLATARRANFQPYALNISSGTDGPHEPRSLFILLPEKEDGHPNSTLELAAGLFGETYERRMPLLDFFLASEGEGNDVHLLQREALLHYFRPQFQHRRVSIIRPHDHKMREAEKQAREAGKFQEYLESQLGRLGMLTSLLAAHTAQRTGMTLMSLRPGCNPAFFDYLDQQDVTYAAVVPRYQKQRGQMCEGQLIFTTMFYRAGWVRASDHLTDIRMILTEHGVREEPLVTAYDGSNEAGYARIHKTTQSYALPDGVVTVELLSMRGKNNDATNQRALLTVSVPSARRDIAEALGRYVHAW